MTVAAELADLELALVEATTSDVELLSRVGRQVVQAGGKRLRPRVLLLSYRAAGGRDSSRALPAAVVVELLHTASLVHDDINDRSQMRRGHPSVNAQLGDDLALLIGDYLFVKAQSVLATIEPAAARAIADCCVRIVEGETVQFLSLRNPLAVDREDYLAIVARKTASFFQACGEAGARLAGAPEELVSAVRDYGLNLGMAFQIRDDVLDAAEDGAVRPPQTAALRGGRNGGSAATAAAVAAEPALVAGPRGDAERLAGGYAAAAVRALRALSPSPARDELAALADYAWRRDE